MVHRVGAVDGRAVVGNRVRGGAHSAHLEPALLVLADGTTFEGEAFGAPAGAAATGELVFNTALSGYQEIITDPSYAGQVVTFTYPHIGNYGTNPDDDECDRPHVRGIVTRDLAVRPSNHRSTESLDAFLARHGVPGITGIDKINELNALYNTTIFNIKARDHTRFKHAPDPSYVP